MSHLSVFLEGRDPGGSHLSLLRAHIISRFSDWRLGSDFPQQAGLVVRERAVIELISDISSYVAHDRMHDQVSGDKIAAGKTMISV
jgi:hypothetical protein